MVLEINKLNKKFGRNWAVRDLSFSVERGNVYGLLGPNGSGKSTTLGMILNVVNRTSGSYQWFGEAPSTASLKRIGAIIERPNFYPFLTAEKNLRLVAKIKEADPEKIAEKLELVGLLDRARDKFKTYSLGMKQRLAIAAALLNDPEILILDEPTNGLDPEGILQIRQIIQKVAATGTTIILASHLLDEVEKVCTHVVVLQKGRTLYSGSVENMTTSQGSFVLEASNLEELENELLQMAYFGPLTRNNNRIIAPVVNDLSASSLNKHLVEKGIFLSHLERKKESLEDQFFQLTQKQNA